MFMNTATAGEGERPLESGQLPAWAACLIIRGVVVFVDMFRDAGMWLVRRRRTLGFFESVLESGKRLLANAVGNVGSVFMNAISSEGTAAPGGEAKEADEETRDQQRRDLPQDWQSMTKTQRRNWMKTQAKRREREKGKGETSEMLALATIPLE